MSGFGTASHFANDAAPAGHTGLVGEAGRQGRTGLAHGGAGEDRPALARDEPEEVPRVMVPALAAALARELIRRVDEDHRLTKEAPTSPRRDARRRIDDCRRDNAEALRTIVRRHGWPTADLVGAPASTAALMILLHAPDLDFQLACRDLIARAVADGHCPAPHHAYIADHCAVELDEPQFYGTRVDPATFRPYPIRRPQTLDERRRDVGLCPLDEQMRTLRLGSIGRLGN